MLLFASVLSSGSPRVRLYWFRCLRGAACVMLVPRTRGEGNEDRPLILEAHATSDLSMRLRRWHLVCFAAACAACWCIHFIVANKGKIVETPALACAEAWNETRLAWVMAYAIVAQHAIRPLACHGSGQSFRRHAYLPVRAGCVVFVRTSHMKRWVTEVLPSVGNRTRFALVTSDVPTNDFARPFKTNGLVTRVLAHPAVAGWWSTNSLDPRVHMLPLGLQSVVQGVSTR